MAVVRAVILDATLQIIGFLFLFGFLGKVLAKIFRKFIIEVI